jgi:hypothetical protein
MASDPVMRQFLVDTGKQALEANHDMGDDEFMPTLVIERDGKYEIALMIGAHPTIMMRASVPMLREQQPNTLGLTVDSFMAQGDAETVLSMRERHDGSLAAAFAAGEEGVYETLVIYIVSASDHDVIQLPYTRTDKGIVWHEDVEFPTHAVSGGDLLDAMQAVWS